MGVPDNETFHLQNVCDAIEQPNLVGQLYNYYAGKYTLITGLALPTDPQITTLTTYLGGLDVAGNKLKEAGTAWWASPSAGTDDYNLSFRPNTTNGYYSVNMGYGHASTTCHQFSCSYSSDDVVRNITGKDRDYSIRLMRVLTEAEQDDYENGQTVQTYSDYNDVDYYLIRVGTQGWLSQAFNGTHTASGTSIPLVADPDDWSGRTTPARRYIDGTPTTHPNNLVSCFDYALEEYFDLDWVDNKNDQHEFRNYGIGNVPTITMTPVAVSHGWAGTYTTMSVVVTPTGQAWSFKLNPPSYFTISLVTQTSFRITSASNYGYNHPLNDMVVGLDNYTNITDLSTVYKAGKLGPGPSGSISLSSSSLVWQWNDYNVTQSVTYSPTTATCSTSGDTGFFTVTTSSGGNISVKAKYRNSVPGTRKVMYIRVTKSGWEDAVLKCTQYEQY